MSAIPSPICASAVCRTSLTFPTKLVPIVCMFTATCSPSRLLVTAPFLTGVKLCSSVFCMLIDCLLHQFLGSIQERVRVPPGHTESMLSTSWNSRLSTCVFACRLCRLLRAGLTIFVERCRTIFRTSFTSSTPSPRSFMIFKQVSERIPYFTSRQASAAKLHWACA